MVERMGRMICPWLKKTVEYRTGSQDNAPMTRYETFCECHREECPWYQPMFNDGSLIIEERCRRAITEYVGAKNGYDKR